MTDHPSRPLLASILAAAATGGCLVGEEQASPREVYLAAIALGLPIDAVTAQIEGAGGVVDQRWSHVEVVRITASEEAAALIAEQPSIVAIERTRDSRDAGRVRPQTRAAAASTQVVPWGVTYVGGPVAPTGASLWVLDTGVDLDHPDLLIDHERSLDVVALFDGDDLEPELEHGTAVAGVAAALDNERDVVGVAPGAPVVSVRVIDSDRSGHADVLVAGLDYTASRASPGDVVNLSIAARGRSTVVETAVARLADRGLAIVIAAGNEARDAIAYTPAGLDHPGVYTVSAIGQDGCLAALSNFGETIDLAAPGVDIVTLAPGGGTAVSDGTSLAAPHVAGLLLAGALGRAGAPCGDRDASPEPIAHRTP